MALALPATTPDACPAGSRCGTTPGYRMHCRCPGMLERHRHREKAMALVRARGGANRVSSVPSRRRIDALRRQGWPIQAIIARAGLGATSNPFGRSICHATTAAKITKVYDLIGEQPGPSQWTRTYAERKGFPTRWAWGDRIDDPNAEPEIGWVPEDDNDEVDRIAVQRVLSGKADSVGLTRLERLWCVQRLAEQGLDAGEIGYRLTINKGQVSEHLAKIAEFGLNPVKRSSLEHNRDKAADRQRRHPVDLTTYEVG